MYELIKLGHFIAIFIWIISMIAAIFALKMHASTSVAKVLRSVMSLGISLTWLLGAYMAYASGFYLSLWLWVKIALVFGLSGLHGKIAGALRKNEPIQSFSTVSIMFLITLLTVIIVLYLAFLKPF